MKIIGCYPLSNWGGYEIAENESGKLFYRSNNGLYVGDWEEADLIENLDDDGRTWVYNYDMHTFMFPIDEVTKVF